MSELTSEEVEIVVRTSAALMVKERPNEEAENALILLEEMYRAKVNRGKKRSNNVLATIKVRHGQEAKSRVEKAAAAKASAAHQRKAAHCRNRPRSR